MVVRVMAVRTERPAMAGDALPVTAADTTRLRAAADITPAVVVVVDTLPAVAGTPAVVVVTPAVEADILVVADTVVAITKQA